MKYLFSSLAFLSAFIPLWSVYQSSYFVVTLSAGFLLGLATSCIGIWTKINKFIVVALGFVLFFLLGVPATLPEQTTFTFIPSVDGISQFFFALITSWRDVMTIPPPLGTYGNTLVPVYLLAFVGEILLFSLLRFHRSQRFALLIPIITLSIATILTGTGGFLPILSGFAVVTFTLATAALFAPHVRAWKVRALITVLITLTVTFVLSGMIGVPPAQDLRSSVGVPLKLDQQASPLALYRALVSEPLASTDLLTVSDMPKDQLISLAKMDDYDNQFFRLGEETTDFVRRAAFKSAVDTARIQDNQITLQQIDGPWLPLPGDLVSLSFQGDNAANSGAAFFYSAPSGTAVSTNKKISGESYRTNTIPIPLVPFTEAQNFTPTTPSKNQANSFSALDEFVSASTNPGDNPGQRLYQSLKALSSGSFIVWDENGNPNPIGHDQARLAQFLTTDKLAGDAEQFAAVATLLAQKAGFTSRVVVGFLSNGSPQITGKDATAWVEILTTEGWKAIDPTPGALAAALAQEQQSSEVVPSTSQLSPSPSQEPETNNKTQENPIDYSGVLIVVCLFLVIALLTLLASIPLLKSWRAVIRKRREPYSVSVIGAWQELIDFARDLQLPINPAYTRKETAKNLNNIDAELLAEIADISEYSFSPISREQMEFAWQKLSEVKKSISKRIPSGKRLIAIWRIGNRR